MSIPMLTLDELIAQLSSPAQRQVLQDLLSRMEGLALGEELDAVLRHDWHVFGASVGLTQVQLTQLHFNFLLLSPAGHQQVIGQLRAAA